jgi:hypothetical protein
MNIDEIKPDSEWAFRNIKRENVVVVRVDKYGELVYWRYLSNRNDFASSLKDFERDFVFVK